MSLARSRAKSGVTKQERPVRATPVSYWLGLLRSILGGNKWKKISVCVTLCSERRGKIANISNLSDLVCSQHDDISALMKAL